MAPTITELERIAQAAANRAAEKALRDLFRALGIDIIDQQSLNDFRADLVFTRRSRRFRQHAATRAGMVAVGVAVVGLMAAAWEGVKTHLGGAGP